MRAVLNQLFGKHDYFDPKLMWQTIIWAEVVFLTFGILMLKYYHK